MGGDGGSGILTYGDYLQLHDLLKLQGEDRGINSDEMHFIIVHQAFELWFKQVIRELSEARDILDQVPVPEDDIPRVVDHLTRTAEIFRLMAAQWTVLETLTPQGFLAFRDELGTASGFQSFQMRELEIVLGLQPDDRLGGMDPIGAFRRLAERSDNDAAVLARLEAALLLWEPMPATLWFAASPKKYLKDASRKSLRKGDCTRDAPRNGVQSNRNWA